MINYLSTIEIELVLMESSGGYEKKLTYELLSEEFPVQVINARHIKNYVKAKNLKSKNR